MEPDQLARVKQAAACRREILPATYRLAQSVLQGTAPAQADITAARTALEALIALALAGGDQ